MKTLGIYYATACYRNEQGRYYTSPGLGRYLQVLDESFPQVQVILLAPTTLQPLAHLRYPLPERVMVYELPYFETFRGAVKVRRTLRQRFRDFVREHYVHVMWLRYPGAYGTELWLQMKKSGIPTFVELVGDPIEVIKFSEELDVMQRLLGLLLARYHEVTVRRMLRDVPGFAVSGPLAKRFSPTSSTVPVIACSTTTASDFYQREDTCLDRPIRVLFVGAFNHQKSVDTLITAVSIIQNRGISVELHLVGDGPLRGSLKVAAASSLQPNTYHFHGFVVDTAVLHQHYLSADIFVLSSIHEGLPRVIPEAMARSLPVVATAVGGIPEVVVHEETGLLVPPRNPLALADAMQRVVEDGNLRRRLIANSFSLAHQYTVEAFLKRVFDFVRESTGVDLTEACESYSSSQVP